MINVICYMNKEIWDNIVKIQQIYDGYPACFDKHPLREWLVSNNKNYRYTILQLPDYNLNNTHIYGQFAKCNNCGNYYSGWDDFRKEYDDRPKKCLICDGEIIKL